MEMLRARDEHKYEILVRNHVQYCGSVAKSRHQLSLKERALRTPSPVFLTFVFEISHFLE